MKPTARNQGFGAAISLRMVCIAKVAIAWSV